MKAAVVSAPGGPEVLELGEWPRPDPKPDWILIKVKAFGLNRGEVLTRRGHSPMVKFPRVLGIECVGIVANAPGSELVPGTKVAAVVGGMGRAFDGSYAEYACVPATNVYPVTTELDWVRFAAIPESFLTAAGSLEDALEVKPGQSLLIRGGTSSVGLAAATIAANAGLRVLATTRQPARKQALIDNGADAVVIDDGAIAERVRALVPGGADCVLELVGTATLKDSLGCARRGGIVCMTGILGERWTIAEFAPMEAIPSTVKLTIFSSSASTGQGARLQRMVDAVAAGTYRLPIDRIFTLDDIAAAHRWMEESRAIGKIVVTVDA